MEPQKKVGQKSEWDLLESNFPLETFSTSWAVTLFIFCPSPAEQLLPLLSHGKKGLRYLKTKKSESTKFAIPWNSLSGLKRETLRQVCHVLRCKSPLQEILDRREPSVRGLTAPPGATTAKRTERNICWDKEGRRGEKKAQRPSPNQGKRRENSVDRSSPVSPPPFGDRCCLFFSSLGGDGESNSSDREKGPSLHFPSPLGTQIPQARFFRLSPPPLTRADRSVWKRSSAWKWERERGRRRKHGGFAKRREGGSLNAFRCRRRRRSQQLQTRSSAVGFAIFFSTRVKKVHPAKEKRMLAAAQTAELQASQQILSLFLLLFLPVVAFRGRVGREKGIESFLRDSPISLTNHVRKRALRNTIG